MKKKKPHKVISGNTHLICTYFAMIIPKVGTLEYFDKHIRLLHSAKQYHLCINSNILSAMTVVGASQKTVKCIAFDSLC